MWHADDGQLNALLDGELSPAEAREVTAHLASCPECTRRLEEARAFLAEAGELLNVLTPPAAAGTATPSDPHEAPLVAPRAPGPADSASVRKSADRPDSSGAAGVPRTAKEIAVDIDGRTAMTPAIRPVTRDEPAHAPPKKGRVELERLAWAASLILCVGVGYLANEVSHLKRQASEIAGAPDSRTVPPATPAPGAGPTTAAAPAALDRAVRGQRTTAGSAGAGEPRSRPTAHTGKNAPATKPAPSFARPDRSAEVAALPPASPNAGAGAALQQPAPHTLSDAMGNLAAAPAQTAPSGDQARRAAAPSAAGSSFVAASPAPEPQAFRRITLEDAVRILSGSIRLIDGMQPSRVESGPGRLVAGADPERDVVRVTYADARGKRFYLDQQLGDTRTGSFNGLMQGDTLVTTGESGANRVRWVDRKFWLSLTGGVGGDSLRAMVLRVR
jgi:hypothetical protein